LSVTDWLLRSSRRRAAFPQQAQLRFWNREFRITTI
jgi:hypothetical protein